MCSGGLADGSSIGFQPFFGLVFFGHIPLKERMEERVVYKGGLGLSGSFRAYCCLLSFPSLAVSLVHACGCSVYLATSSQKVPKTNISDHSGIYPVSILHSWGSRLEAWRWEGEGTRAKPRVPLEVMGAFWRPPRTLEIVSISLMCIACRKWRSPLLSLSFQSICDSQKPKRY